MVSLSLGPALLLFSSWICNIPEAHCKNSLLFYNVASMEWQSKWRVVVEKQENHRDTAARSITIIFPRLFSSVSSAEIHRRPILESFHYLVRFRVNIKMGEGLDHPLLKFIKTLIGSNVIILKTWHYVDLRPQVLVLDQDLVWHVTTQLVLQCVVYTLPF